MQQVTRFSLIVLLAAGVPRGLRAAEDGSASTSAVPVAKSATKPVTVMKKSLLPTEYKRSDMNFYPKGDFEKDHSGAVIIPHSGYTKKDDSYFYTPKIRAPKNIYIEVLNDWIEPITPPDMPASLGVPPNEMQIREPQGDVQVALPSAPANFSPATANMTLPNGAVVKTGADGTAAVLFGGVDSARLMPNSAAAVQQTVAATSRIVEVDLTAGGVFSKVGTQVGVNGSYEVHSPFGNATAQGGDFVTVITSNRADVWVAQGTVKFENPAAGETPQMVTSDGMGPLKILRAPAIADTHATLLADAETLTPTLNFIPLANQKVKGLRDKQAAGTALSDNEKAYLGRIKQVASLVKLDLVPPPAPPPLAPPIAETPAPTPAPASAPVPPKPVAVATKKPLNVNIHEDGSIGFRGAKMDLTAFQAKLAEIGHATPDQAFLVHAGSNVPDEKLQPVMDSFHAANLERITLAPRPVVAIPPPPAPPVPTPPVATPEPPAIAADVPAPHLAMPPVVPADAATSAPTPVPEATPVKPVAATKKPLSVNIHPDGTVGFRGEKMELTAFQAKLADIGKATPDQAFVVHAPAAVPDEKVTPVMESFHAAGLEHATLVPRPMMTPPALAAIPAAPPVIPADAVTPAPAPTPASEPAPVKPIAATKKPLSVNIHADGTVGFRGEKMELSAFQAKLANIGKASPDQAFTVHAPADVPDEKIGPVMDSFHTAGLEHATLASRPVPPTPSAPAAPAAEVPAPVIAADVPPPHLSVPADDVSAPKPVVATKNPLSVNIHTDGTVGFRGEKMELSAFQAKLADIGKATPDQAFTVHPASDVPPDKMQAVMDSFHTAGLDHATLASPIASTAAKPVKEAPVSAEKAVAAIPVAEPVKSSDKAPKAKAVALAAAPASYPSAPKVPEVPATPSGEVRLHSNGRMEFNGKTVTIDELKAQLSGMSSGQTVQLTQDEQTEAIDSDQVVQLLTDQKLKSKIVKVPESDSLTPTASAPAPATP